MWKICCHVSFQDPKISDASAISTSLVCSLGMLLLIVGY